MSNQLTKHPVGSIRELWTLAYPMILAFLSGNIMMFADRIFLANYSTAAMNAAAAAGMVVVIFQYGSAIVTSIAEVFVGQLNGAKDYKNVGTPTIQMLWVCFVLFFLFILFGNTLGPYLLSDYHYADHGLPYFQWLFYFGACTPAIAAISSFFVGIGNTKIVMAITIIGNLVNLILDPLLIFGVSDWIAPMGSSGAAIATGVSQLTQLVIYLLFFLNAHNRAKYGTTNWKFAPLSCFKYLKIGIPNAIGHMIEWAAWAISLNLMASASEHHLTVATVGQSLYMLIGFGFEGIQKAVTTLAANQIGAKNISGIWITWKAAIKILMISTIPFGVVMLGYPDPIISEFLSTETPASDVTLLTYYLRFTAAGVFLYYILDGLTWISVGVLTAAEDTFYVMWMNAITSWLAALLPVYFFLVYLNWSPALYFFLTCFYGACNALVFYRRLKSEKWTKIIDSKQEAT